MKKRDWSAWTVGEDETRVQIQSPDMAKAFAKVKGVWLAGYGVAGGYIKIFHVRQPVQWVAAWMRKFISHATYGAANRKEAR
jgi:hypothetical protein